MRDIRTAGVRRVTIFMPPCPVFTQPPHLGGNGGEFPPRFWRRWLFPPRCSPPDFWDSVHQNASIWQFCVSKSLPEGREMNNGEPKSSKFSRGRLAAPQTFYFYSFLDLYLRSGGEFPPRFRRRWLLPPRSSPPDLDPQNKHCSKGVDMPADGPAGSGDAPAVAECVPGDWILFGFYWRWNL